MNQFQVLIGNYGACGPDTLIGVFNSDEAIQEGKQLFLQLQFDKPELWEFRVESCELNTVYYESYTMLS